MTQPATTTLPYYGLGDPDATTTVAPPIEDDQTVQHVAEILLAAYVITKMAALLHALFPAVRLEVWMAVLSKSKPIRAKRLAYTLGLNDTPGEKIIKSAVQRETLYRAGYVLNAAHRIEKDVREGKSIPDAVKQELPNLDKHKKARENRLSAADHVAKVALRLGDLLGWYLNPLLNNEIECITANGNNFYASQSTVIGDPGAVHVGCGCTAGPAHWGAGMVNDAIATSNAITFELPGRVALRSVS